MWRISAWNLSNSEGRVGVPFEVSLWKKKEPCQARSSSRGGGCDEAASTGCPDASPASSSSYSYSNLEDGGVVGAADVASATVLDAHLADLERLQATCQQDKVVDLFGVDGDVVRGGVGLHEGRHGHEEDGLLTPDHLPELEERLLQRRLPLPSLKEERPA